MSIRTSSTEGSIHIGLKKKVIEMLKRRNDIQSIDTEVMVNKRKGLRKSHVDVLAKKNDGINIYAEVKSDADLPGAILQLMLIDKKIKGEEFIIVSRYNTPLFLKSLLRPADELTKKMNKEAMEMINKAEIFQFNAKLDLIEMDIRYIDGKQLWIDGIKIMDMSHR